MVADPRDGEHYLEGLRSHPRNVWIDGDLVTDVASDDRLSCGITTIANVFDLHSTTRLRDTLSTVSPTGRRMPISLLQPMSQSDLQTRRIAAEAIAAESLGLVGRSQEFMNTVWAAFSSASDWFGVFDGAFSANVQQIFTEICEFEPYIAHAAIDPPLGRSLAPSQVAHSFGPLRVVERRTSGLVVRGAKLVATGAAVADQLAVFPLPGLREGDEDRSCAFIIPVGTAGLHLLHRTPAVHGLVSRLKYPLAGRFQEIDCVCLFDDVLVPGERVFFHGNVKGANALYDETGARPLTAHRDLVRATIKLRFLAGLATLLAQSATVDAFPHVQEMLGELIGFEAIVGAALRGSESGAADRARQMFLPDPRVLLALRYSLPQMFARAGAIIQAIGGASLLTTPSGPSATGSIEELALAVFEGQGASPINRQTLLAIARDAATSEYAQRQLLFEKYHAGDPVRLSAINYMTWSKRSLDFASHFLTGVQDQL